MWLFLRCDRHASISVTLFETANDVLKVLEWFIAFANSQKFVGFLFDWDRIGHHETGIFRGFPAIRRHYFVRADAYSWRCRAGKAAII
jgi:hypothetical protein